MQAARDALATTPPDDPDRAARLGNLAIALWWLFERTRDTAVLAEAAQAARDAVDATPVGHPDRAAYLSGLGNVVATRSNVPVVWPTSIRR